MHLHPQSPHGPLRLQQKMHSISLYASPGTLGGRAGSGGNGSVENPPFSVAPAAAVLPLEGVWFPTLPLVLFSPALLSYSPAFSLLSPTGEFELSLPLKGAPAPLPLRGEPVLLPLDG